jgi:hypothetical protein
MTEKRARENVYGDLLVIVFFEIFCFFWTIWACCISSDAGGFFESF